MNAPHAVSAIWPRAELTEVPYALYTDPAVYALEQERLFRGPTWNYLGLKPELPNPGDFKTNVVGDTPVVLCRDTDGSLHAWVNRCAHRGALVCRELRGNSASGTHTCVYHQWAYDNQGALIGVPFRKGLGGKGGYPADFDMASHGLQKLRVECVESMVFATFDEQAEPLQDYLGPVMLANIRRVLGRPIELLGTTRQQMRGNWKLYAENTRDSYHGALLHLFYPTFGIYRPAQDSPAVMDEGHRFHNLFQIMTSGSGGDVSEYQTKGMRAMPAADALADRRVIEFKDDYGDGVSLTIQSLFPNVVLQQIQNTLATRQIVTRGISDTEVVWTFFGYLGESAEVRAHRLRNINLVGPAGFISMEDGEAVEIVQHGLVGVEANAGSVLAMGGDSDSDLDRLGMDENSIRGFWRGYRQFMQL